MTWRAIALVAGVTVLGMVGGAAWAAPAEVLPMAREAGSAIGGASRALAADAAQWLSAARTALPAPGVITRQLAEASPRALAMLATGAAALLAGLAALVVHHRANRAGERAGSAPTTPSPRGRAPSGSMRAVRLPRSAASPIPTAPPRRRAKGSTAPSQVHAMAARGSSPADIARATGLPVDAVSLLLSVALQERQVPHVTA
jgi:hypothetical protein